MTLYRSGNYEAFECLYQRHSGRVFEYLKRRVSSEAAKDLLQEIFVKIHRSRDQYLEQYPFLPWLFTITRNQLADFFKQAETKAIKIEIEPELIPAEALFQQSDHDLTAILSSLPLQQRRAIELRYMNEWTFEKIAEELKTTPSNTRQIISRGIKKLRSLLHGGK